MTRHFDLLSLSGELVGSHPLALPILKISLLLAVGWILHGLLRARNPRWRILLWRGAAVGTLVIALLAFIEPLVSLNWLPAAPHAEIASSPLPQMFENPPIEPMRPLPEPPVYSPPAVLPPDAAPMASPVAPMESEVAPVAEGWPVGVWLIGIWAIGFVVLGLRTLVAMLRLSGIRRRATQIPEWLHADANALFADIRGITICHSAQIPAPCSVGIFRPLTLLPTALCHERHREELRAAIAHEAAHFAGRDLIWNWILHAMTVIGWFHPLAWRIRLAHADACDERCDAEAAQRLGDTANYTRSLARIALSIHPTQTPMVMTMARQSTIRRRLEVLAAALGHRKLPPARAWSVVLLAALVTLTVGTLGITQSTAEEERTAKTSEADKPEPTTEKATAPPEATFIKKVRVVDPDGKPVVGAEVEPWAVRTPVGINSRFGSDWVHKLAQFPLKTDTNGEVGILLPRDLTQHLEELPPSARSRLEPSLITKVFCHVKHPNFAIKKHFDVIDFHVKNNRTTIVTLKQGAQIEVTATFDGKKIASEDTCALVSSVSNTIPIPGHPGTNGTIDFRHLPSGRSLFRLAHFPPNGRALFSDPVEITPESSQSIPLSLELQPSSQVTGKLQDSVPRPIKNGHVTTFTVDSLHGVPAVRWINATPIHADGTFTLESVPHGNLQVMALCDGFVSSNGATPDFANEWEQRNAWRSLTPQVFPISRSEEHIQVKMHPAGIARVQFQDSNNQPIPNVFAGFYPDTLIWQFGKTPFGTPMVRTRDLIGSAAERRKLDNTIFRGLSNAEGLITFPNLPPGNRELVAANDGWELPPPEETRYHRIIIKPGEITDVAVTLQPKGLEPIPAFDSQPKADGETEKTEPATEKSTPEEAKK